MRQGTNEPLGDLLWPGLQINSKGMIPKCGKEGPGSYLGTTLLQRLQNFGNPNTLETKAGCIFIIDWDMFQSQQLRKAQSRETERFSGPPKRRPRHSRREIWSEPVGALLMRPGCWNPFGNFHKKSEKPESSRWTGFPLPCCTDWIPSRVEILCFRT